MIRAKLDSHWNYILEQFENVYPELASEAVHWYSSGYNDIIVILEDGRRFLYNYMSHNLVPYYEPDNLYDEEEAEWRTQFSYRLRRRMNDALMSQEQLAEQTGISKVTISKYMNGKATPSAYNMRRIRDVLKCTPMELE